MEPTHRFLRACRGLPVDRVPIWMMRQAGRYLPSYRRVRATTTFLGLCKTPELACEVTLQPIDEFGMDAAILFSDILVPLEAMGMELVFTEEGPSLPSPVRTAADVDRLRIPDPLATMPFVAEAIRHIKRGLAGRVPLIGFAGAPFTMASYAVEGGGSKTYLDLKRMMFAQPATAHRLLEKLSETISLALEAQLEAGADALQIFDSWAGILSPRDFDEFAARWARDAIERIRSSRAHKNNPVPIIYFANGGSPYLSRLRSVGADVYGIDWKTDIAEARKHLGTAPVQGNLDPTALFLPPEKIEERVREILAAAGGVGHIFNLGHGILPPTDPEHVRAMVQAVHRYGQLSAPNVG